MQAAWGEDITNSLNVSPASYNIDNLERYIYGHNSGMNSIGITN